MKKTMISHHKIAKNKRFIIYWLIVINMKKELKTANKIIKTKGYFSLVKKIFECSINIFNNNVSFFLYSPICFLKVKNIKSNKNLEDLVNFSFKVLFIRLCP